jgi:hypothetical protein
VPGLASPAPDTRVVGDPCVVWDDEATLWRMFLFHDPPGHGQAVARTSAGSGPFRWDFLGPIPFVNPSALLGGATHKPFVVMRPDGANHAAKVDGRYWLLTVSFSGGHKVIQRAFAKRLAGPWTLEEGPLLDLGDTDAFDGNHLDAVSGYYFESQQEFHYHYMAYPLAPQRPGHSPFGSAQALAVQGRQEPRPRKLGLILPPSTLPGHWASGWVGGLQIMPGAQHRWIGLANASPSPPHPSHPGNDKEEPAPSLGGFAFSDAALPSSGWQWLDQPIERLNDLPRQALEWGECCNLWRHHLLAIPGQKPLLLYNSGVYGKERLYAKEALP